MSPSNFLACLHPLNQHTHTHTHTHTFFYHWVIVGASLIGNFMYAGGGAA